MIYVCISFRQKNNVVKVKSCYTEEYDGDVSDFLKERFPNDMENGIITRTLFDSDQSYYLSNGNKMIYAYLVPQEQEHALLDSLKNRLVSFTSK